MRQPKNLTAVSFPSFTGACIFCGQSFSTYDWHRLDGRSKKDMKGEGEGDAASTHAPFEAEANDTVLIFELIKAILGQDNIPPHVRKLLGGLITRHGFCIQKWMKKEGLHESQFRKLLMKSKKGLAAQITAIKAALSTSCGKAYHQTKELADAATDTDDLVQTAAIGTMSLPIEPVPFPSSHNTDENGYGGSMGDGECMGGGESSDDDEEEDDENIFNAEGALLCGSDSDLAQDATESDGVRRSTRQRPAPQALSPSPPPKPKKAKGRRKKKGKKKTTTANVDGDDDDVLGTSGDDNANAAGEDRSASETTIADRDLAGRLTQLDFSYADDQQIQNVIDELQQELDASDKIISIGQDHPLPQYVAGEIPVVKMVVETLKMFVRGDITPDQLKQSTADFFTFIEPYQELVEQLLVLENKTVEVLKSEQNFRVKGKTLGDALKSTTDDSTQEEEDDEASRMDELGYARGVVKNAQEATQTSSKRSLLDCLRLKNTLRNAIRFLLNFRVAVDVLERGTVADFVTAKKDQKKALELAKDVGALDCASTDCNAMKFFSAVIFQCDKDNSNTKVELILAFVKGMKGFKRNQNLKDLYRKAATLDITSGQYKGESDYFDGKDGEGRINLPSMTLMVIALGDDVDEQLVKVGLVPTRLDFTASVFVCSIREMEKMVGFVTKKKFWTGIFDAVRTSKFDSHKLTRGDVFRKLDDICKKADEKMDDYQRKYMLLPVDNLFVKALIRFRDICTKRHTKS